MNRVCLLCHYPGQLAAASRGLFCYRCLGTAKADRYLARRRLWDALDEASAKAAPARQPEEAGSA